MMFIVLFRFVAGLDCLGLVQEMKKCPSGYARLFLFTESPLSATIILDQIIDNIELRAEVIVGVRKMIPYVTGVITLLNWKVNEDFDLKYLYR